MSDNFPALELNTVAQSFSEMRLVRESTVAVRSWDARPDLRSPSKTADFMKPFAARETAETLWIVPLCPGGRLMTDGPIVCGRGSLDMVLAHPREIFRALLAANASQFVMVHNHPTCDLIPSQADRLTADRCAEIGKLMQIPMLGSIVITPDGKWTMVPFGQSPLADMLEDARINDFLKGLPKELQEKDDTNDEDMEEAA